MFKKDCAKKVMRGCFTGHPVAAQVVAAARGCWEKPITEQYACDAKCQKAGVPVCAPKCEDAEFPYAREDANPGVCFKTRAGAVSATRDELFMQPLHCDDFCTLEKADFAKGFLNVLPGYPVSSAGLCSGGCLGAETTPSPKGPGSFLAAAPPNTGYGISRASTKDQNNVVTHSFSFSLLNPEKMFGVYDAFFGGHANGWSMQSPLTNAEWGMTVLPMDVLPGSTLLEPGQQGFRYSTAPEKCADSCTTDQTQRVTLRKSPCTADNFKKFAEAVPDGFGLYYDPSEPGFCEVINDDLVKEVRRRHRASTIDATPCQWHDGGVKNGYCSEKTVKLGGGAGGDEPVQVVEPSGGLVLCRGATGMKELVRTVVWNNFVFLRS